MSVSNSYSSYIKALTVFIDFRNVWLIGGNIPPGVSCPGRTEMSPAGELYLRRVLPWFCPTTKSEFDRAFLDGGAVMSESKLSKLLDICDSHLFLCHFPHVLEVRELGTMCNRNCV